MKRKFILFMQSKQLLLLLLIILHNVNFYIIMFRKIYCKFHQFKFDRYIKLLIKIEEYYFVNTKINKNK